LIITKHLAQVHALVYRNLPFSSVLCCKVQDLGSGGRKSPAERLDDRCREAPDCELWSNVLARTPLPRYPLAVCFALPYPFAKSSAI
jgi:hypothetical protein